MSRYLVIAALLADTLAAQAPVRTVAAKTSVVTVAARTPVRTVARQARSVVVIDAGHGGRDPGGPMRLGRYAEKDVTLQVALKVGDALRVRGVDVVFTRTTDTLIALDDRGRIANEARGQLFISIHVNAANPHWRNPTAARGFETYFLAEAKTEDARRVEEMENASIQFESSGKVDAGDALSFILSDMRQNEHLRESSDLAGIVQRHLHDVHPGPDRGVKQAGFRVLVSAFMPAVLVELGFGTNRSDAEFIATPAKQRMMAKAIADATTEYLERYQRRVGGGAGGNSSHD